jgi:hypothetical protein
MHRASTISALAPRCGSSSSSTSGHVIARDGEKLGHVPETAVLRLQ